MAFKDLLKEKLGGKINENLLELLPSGFQNIGIITFMF